jgi:hypothetical protein
MQQGALFMDKNQERVPFELGLGLNLEVLDWRGKRAIHPLPARGFHQESRSFGASGQAASHC